MRNALFVLFTVLFIWSCGSGGEQASNKSGAKTSKEEPKIDDGKGVGEITSVSLNDPLNQGMVSNGKAIYELKCSACHKLGEKRLVGPGFTGVTDRRKPEWIMNMITNVDIMLDKDPAAQKLLEECLTRMPNQNVSNEDARDVLEFLLNNDKS